ncbi:unnamed protein product [Auanema sp. JU1783]|nr:unnamed protein product [Auanema sp. JU1783]
MEHRFWLFLIQFLLLISLTVQTGCLRRYYPGPKQLVCACNSTFCDEFPRVGRIPVDSAVLISSSQNGFRFEREDLRFSSKFFESKEKENVTRILIDGRQRFQTIHGFGGAFTDSVGINLETLTESAQKQLINAYFSEKGQI